MPRPGGSTRQWRSTRAEVWLRDRGLCRTCGVLTHAKRCTPQGCPRCYQAGHVIPIARGGTDLMTNLIALCSECNAAQADVTWVRT